MAQTWMSVEIAPNADGPAFPDAARVIDVGGRTLLVVSFERHGNDSVYAQAHAELLRLGAVHGVVAAHSPARLTCYASSPSDADVVAKLTATSAPPPPERGPRRRRFIERLGLGGAPERNTDLLPWLDDGPHRPA